MFRGQGLGIRGWGLKGGQMQNKMERHSKTHALWVCVGSVGVVGRQNQVIPR